MSKTKKAIIICSVIVLLLTPIVIFAVELSLYGVGFQLYLDFSNYDRVDYKLVLFPPEDTDLYRLNEYTRMQLANYMKQNDLLIEPNDYRGYNLITSSGLKQLLDVLVFIKDPNAKT